MGPGWECRPLERTPPTLSAVHPVVERLGVRGTQRERPFDQGGCALFPRNLGRTAYRLVGTGIVGNRERVTRPVCQALSRVRRRPSGFRFPCEWHSEYCLTGTARTGGSGPSQSWSLSNWSPERTTTGTSGSSAARPELHFRPDSSPVGGGHCESD